MDSTYHENVLEIKNNCGCFNREPDFARCCIPRTLDAHWQRAPS